MKIWNVFNRFIFGILSLLLPALLRAQPCAPAFPLPIRAIDSASLTFEVHGIVNNSLASPTQGLCELRLNFVHSAIFDFEVWLRSPAGETIQLIGPNITGSKPFPIGANFNVRFTPCANDAAPDPGFQPVWNNIANVFNAESKGFYKGFYYPFQGCLEDLDSGAVNGNWTLTVKTLTTLFAPRTIQGFLRDVELVFCDETGRHCCFADAGMVESDTLTACAGDTSLDWSARTPRYDSTRPDSTYHGYTWAIRRDSTLFAYAPSPDLRTYPAGNYEVCGLSYSLADSSLLPATGSTIRLSALRDSLNAPDPPFCGDLSTQCFRATILPVPDTLFVQDSICPGDLYRIGNRAFSTPGTYDIRFTAASGCDSIVQVSLRFRSAKISRVQITICDEDSLTVGDRSYRLPGIYTDTIPAANGCDSILTVELSVVPTPTRAMTKHICQGAGFSLGGRVFRIAGEYRVRVPAPSGCDSLILLSLVVLNPQVAIRTPEAITCDRQEVVLNGADSGPSGLINFRWTGPDGTLLGQDSTLRVRTPGRYQLRVFQSVQDLFCAAQTAVTVLSDLTPPDIAITGIDTLTCSRKNTTLLGVNRTSARMGYQWAELAQPPSPRDTSAILSVNRPGSYVLIGRNLGNGCRDTASFKVVSDTLAPPADAGPDQWLTCTRKVLRLGNSNAPTVGFTYQWSASDGLPVNNSTSPSVLALRPATWRLMVRSLRNGCSALDSAVVAMDTIRPIAEAGFERMLTCKNPSARLNAGASSTGARFSFTWETEQGGRIAADPNSLTPQVDAAGLYRIIVTDVENGCAAKDSVLVTATLEKPELPFIREEVLNCRDTLAVLNAPLPNDPNYSYRWCSPVGQCENQLFFTARTSGVYTFELTNTETGCSNSKQVQVTQDIAPPLVEAGKTEIFRCNQTEIQLNGTTGLPNGRFTAAWTATGGWVLSDKNTLTPIVSGPGLYTLTVQDLQNFCSASDTVRVVPDTRFPKVYAGPDTILTCANPSLRLPATTNLPAWGFECSWTTPDGRIAADATKLNALVNREGLYILTVRDRSNGCSSSDSVRVQNQIIFPTAALDQAAPNYLLTCQYDTLTINASPSASGTGAELLFYWRNLSNGGFAPTDQPNAILASLPGTYLLVVQDAYNSCADSLEINVEADQAPPIFQITPADVLTCARPQAELAIELGSNDTKVRIAWEDPDGNILTSNGPPVPVTKPGQYRVTLTNLKNGCAAQGFTQVRENQKPPAIVFAPVEALDCNTRKVRLDASATRGSRQLSFAWSTRQGTLTGTSNSSRTEAGTAAWYTLRVDDLENGCSATDSLRVVADSNRVDSVAYSVTAPGCSPNRPGAIAVLGTYGGKAPYRFSLNNALPDSTRTFRQLSPGTYSLLVRDAEDCELTVPVEVPQPVRISVDLGPDLSIKEGDSARLEALVFPAHQSLSFRWIGVEGLSGKNEAVEIVRPLHSTTYEVRVVADNLCSASDFIRVNVVQELPVFIPNAFSPNGDGQNDFFFIYTRPEFSKVKSFRIFDRTGAMVFSRDDFYANDPTQGWDGRLFDQEPQTGVYVYVAVIITPSGREVVLKGDVTLMR
ncbi:MAG: gliding motility-associated C-terminal domain-containing protein [Saprospiraceae bacterium]|jgi:gliding motility-associated-like protein